MPGKTGRSFLAVLADASTKESFENSVAGLEPGTDAGKNTAKSGAGIQQAEPSPVLQAQPASREASTNATKTLPGVEPDKVPAKGTSKTQEDGPAPSREASESSAAAGMPLSAPPSTVTANVQEQFVAAQAAPGAELAANQQPQMTTEIDRNSDPSAITVNVQDQFVAAQATQETSAAELPANQLAQRAGEADRNSDPSTVAPDIQAQFVAAQGTQETSAAELPANQQAHTAAATMQDGPVAERPHTEITSNRAQIVDGPTVVTGEMMQASLQLPMPVAFLDNAAAGADGAAGGKQPAKAADLKAAPSTIAPKNPVLGKATDADINNTALTTAGTHNASSGGQTSGQSAQNMNGSPDQTGSVSARVAASSLPQAEAQVQTISVSGSSHETASSDPMPRGLADGSRLSAQGEVPIANQQEIGEGAATTAINSAKLIQAMGQTEMRVGLHTSEFGDISIRTSVSQQQMQAQISLDHPELSQAIAAHISAAQTKLGDEHGIQASIQINNQGTSNSSDSGQPSQRQQNSFTGFTGPTVNADYVEAENGMSFGVLSATGNEHRLDIRA
jgi:hypothetical protein